MGDNAYQSPVDPVVSRAELETVLASHSFVRAPTVSKILAYVCKKHLEGAGDSITEWSIAVDALGRRQNFDPEKDSIVRVEFHLLRKRLAEYYQTEGASHSVRISFAESGYVPRFIALPPKVETKAETRAPVAEPPALVLPAPAALPAPRPGWFKFAVPAVIGLLGIGAVASAWIVRTRDPAVSAAIASRDAVLKVPADHLSADDAIRIAVGVPSSKYVDSSGHVWLGDLYVTGGMPFDRSDRKIFRTLDQDLYEKGREGEFRYDIPAKSGVYELRLHFAETRFGQTPAEGAEAMRRFDVSLNNKPILEDFDIALDAGESNTATVKVWKDVSPGPDGMIHLVFYGRYGRPLLNAIELLPGIPGAPLPVRIVCGLHPVYDKLGRFWQADEYFLGGRQTERRHVYEGTDDLALYTSLRFGNFNYAIPVVAGETYRAKLRFADYNSQLPGDRIFDVFCNGVTLCANLDIVKRAGGHNHATQIAFRGLKPNAQSKLVFAFVPTRDYASVHAIEIEAERD